MLQLTLGGAKSGKTDYALSRLLQAEGPHAYLATAEPGDFSMRRQVLDHRASRPAGVFLHEADEDLCGALDALLARGFGSVLIDSLDFWLFRCRFGDNGGEEHVESLVRRLESLAGDRPAREGGTDIFIVSSEINLGPTPADAAVRAYTRELGALHQRIAAAADEVVFILAGLPVYVKR